MGADVDVDAASKEKSRAGDGDAGTEVNSHSASFSIAEITGSHIDTPITTFVERASEDNRRSYRKEVVVTPPSPVKRHRAGQTHAAPAAPIHNVYAKASDAGRRNLRNGIASGISCSVQIVWWLLTERTRYTGSSDGMAGCFVPSSLRELGLRVQLGHPPGERCSEPFPLNSSHFIVLHTNGIHDMAVDTCDCERRLWAGPPEEQLQRAGWFPATDHRPRTCATVEMLDHFLLQTYQAKTTMYDYYSVLEKTTNNTGIKPPNRYHAFLRMVREYSHLLMLKRAGRGHAISGVMGTQQGELAVRRRPPEFQFFYIIFIAIDACLRLKHRLVSSVLKDPSLVSGWAYMVESVLYRQFLLTVTDQKEMSTCSGLAALDHANTKFLCGYAATGVGMWVCAQHEFVQPNGVGDLQKGERYANMDWIAACIMIALDPRLRKIISYDIVCQWWVNLKKRLLLLPPAVRWNLVLGLVRFVIPKLHIKGHKIPCQDKYSLELVPRSAQTDGEGIEQPWAHIGGGRKVVGMGERLRTKRDRAAKEYATQLDSFTLFSTEQGEHVAGWCKMVEAYKADNTQKNPYRMTTRGLTEAQVLLEFEQEESEHAAAGVPSIHSVSPSSFIAAGLNVEEEQRRVRIQVELKKLGTTAQQIDIVAMRRALNRSLRRLRELQATYTPMSILALGQRENVPDDEQPEHIPLFSSVRLDTRPALGRFYVLVGAGTLRRKLHVKSQLVTYKSLQARVQGANTRAKGIVDRNDGSWPGGDAAAVGWKKLLKEDIRCMEDPEELSRKEHKRKAQDERRRQREDGLRREGELPPLTEEEEHVARGGESVRQVSWIWTGAGMMGADADLEDALRIEWCKAYARTRCWREEMLLVEEEVRWVGVTLEFRACKWDRRAMEVPIGESQWEEWNWASDGLAGATVFRDIAAHLTVSMTEVRQGRGKRRLVYDDEWVDREGNSAAGISEGGANEEQELEDLQRDEVADDDFILGGGADED
ncbi:hypothetical protein B0H14DRAFT_3483063 [Mycena olivaceomarginata]|nr:hypothetical protein B0H14DRAFT_3483063 [Mycena olivaceomarginata]